jgi:hypothetical protein
MIAREQGSNPRDPSVPYEDESFIEPSLIDTETDKKNAITNRLPITVKDGPTYHKKPLFNQKQHQSKTIIGTTIEPLQPPHQQKVFV